MSDELKAGCFLLITHYSSLITSLQVSVGDLSELVRPALFALSALASGWVFHDARGRLGFGRASVWAWALLTLAFPPAVLPLYLAARLYTRRDGAEESTVEDHADDEGDADADEGGAAEDASGPSALRRLAPALLYTAALMVGGAAYFYDDYQSFDAHLARAERAKLYQRPEEAMREYRAALRLREDAHTRRLLGVELLRAGRAEEALGELRAAARAGEADDQLAFDAAAALEALARRDEAAGEYRRFLDGDACRPPAHADAARCEWARERLAALEGRAR